MASIRDVLNRIDVDLSGPNGSIISVNKELFGFHQSRVPADPEGFETKVSLLEKIRSLQGKHIHLNILRVGHDQYSELDENRLDFAIYRAHEIYAQKNLGIGRVLHFNMNREKFKDYERLGYPTDNEASKRRSKKRAKEKSHELSRKVAIDNDGIDMFVVLKIYGYLGRSPICGPDEYQKEAHGKYGAKKAVIAGFIDRADHTSGKRKKSDLGFARTFSHELGHYLGLHHTCVADNTIFFNHPYNPTTLSPCTAEDRDNLMSQTGPAWEARDSIILTDKQGKKIRKHGIVKNGIPK